MSNINKINVMDEKWDYLVILDACRYDYFEEVWKNYFDTATLTCRNTIGTTTTEWRDNSFTGYYDDVVYVSANPYINSVKSVRGFLTSEHFHKIYDVWQSGWDEELGTVLPETVTNAAIDIIQEHKDKRAIIHYLQPHAPYLSLGTESYGFPTPDLDAQNVITGINKNAEESKFKRKLLKKLLPIFKKTSLFGDHPEWFLRQFLSMAPRSPMDAARRKFGKKGLRKAYRANLEAVLAQTVILLKHLSGTIIITADHGEYLGENRCYTHAPSSSSPYLRQVPWLVIEKEKADIDYVPDKAQKKIDSKPSTADETDKAGSEQIEEKLRSLGYLDE